MEWLKSNWLKVGLLVFAIALWTVRMEMAAQAGSDHRKESCEKWCIDACLESCKWQNIQPKDCNCNHCFQKCGN